MRSAVAAAAIALLLAGAAHAQSQPAAGGDASSPDAARAPPPAGWGGQGGQRPPLTPAQQQARRALREACAADMQKLCGDASANAQRPFQCMRQHMRELSPGCVSAMQAMRAARRGEPTTPAPASAPGNVAPS